MEKVEGKKKKQDKQTTKQTKTHECVSIIVRPWDKHEVACLEMVGQFGLIKKYSAVVAKPLGQVTHFMLDKETIDDGAIAIHLQSGLGIAAVARTATVVVILNKHKIGYTQTITTTTNRSNERTTHYTSDEDRCTRTACQNQVLSSTRSAPLTST